MQISEREKVNSEIAEYLKKSGTKRSVLLPLMQFLQSKYGVVNDIMMQEAAEALGIKPVEVHSTLSFYSFFSTKMTGKYIIRLCKTVSCDMAGKDRVARQLENELGISFGETTKDNMFTLEYASCLGMCDQGPALLVNDKIFTKVTPERVPEIIRECRKNSIESKDDLKEVASELKNPGPIFGETVKKHEGLRKALSMSRVDVIGTIRDSNLKGRGGAGFPTGVKWQLAAASKGDAKFIVCNADEGEPGTFKDRLLLMNFTDLVFDGMTIAGYAVGAEKGIIYLRAEYTFLKKYLDKMLEKYRSENLLGRNVLGKDQFNFDIEIRMGAGAYVCGEETALIESLEGKRGEPRNRPPFPVVAGYDGYPTAVNNVETFVNAALIIDKGAEWFKGFGTEKTAGTKLFSVSGDCRNPGIYEFPMGITVKELLKQVGGEDAKAVQIGGASGICLPEKQFERTISYEDVATGGSIIVIGKNRDMLEVAENFMDFFVEESCGQCFLCRKGNVKILEGIEKFKKCEGSSKLLKDLTSLGKSMQKASKCGLGQSSANAFLSITEHFTDEILGRVPCRH